MSGVPFRITARERRVGTDVPKHITDEEMFLKRNVCKTAISRILLQIMP